MSDIVLLPDLYANQAASAAIFQEYRSRKSANTLRRQDNDLVVFAGFLDAVQMPAGDLSLVESWRGIRWGMVAGFVRWLLMDGYAVSTVNVRLSTVKVYATMAAMAGVLDRQEQAMIREVHSYRYAEAVHLDEQREDAGLPIRRTARWTGGETGKKATAVIINDEQAAALKLQPDTPQGRRDALLMCLLLEHGLRIGEISRLTVDCFDLKLGRLRFYRPKVNKVQTHKLTPASLAAARAYILQDAPALGSIWRGSRKGSDLTGPGLGTRAATERVRILGEAVGLKGLSAHDCRHYWASLAARHKSPLERLRDAGGWSSLAMPVRYIQEAAIANDGIKLE